MALGFLGNEKDPKILSGKLTMANRLVLASASPRRKELLTQLGYEFDIVQPNIDEQVLDNESPVEYVTRLAEQKAKAGYNMVNDESMVIGSDTSVIYQNEIMGKPSCFEDAATMLGKLSGQTHQVMTAVAICTGKGLKSKLVVTDVSFRHLSDDEIAEYWFTGEPKDKAGSYGVQGIAGKFVTNINGSYSAVVGLPLMETGALIEGMAKHEC